MVLLSRAHQPSTYTGSETLPWSGGKTGGNYAVQGNLLTGPEVIDAMAAAFETTDGALSTRLVNDRLVDLHVEDHPTPIKELYRLLNIRLSQVAVEDAGRSLKMARTSDDATGRAEAIAEARARAARAVGLYEFGDAGWVALAGAEAGNLAAASEAARRALMINPVLKRYSATPETGLGIEPELLKRLLDDARFRKLWDAMPGDDEIEATGAGDAR